MAAGRAPGQYAEVSPGATTRTLLFTDMVGSTALRSQLGDGRVDEIRRDHDALIAELVSAHTGTVVKGTGDGLMAAFEGAADAVACAVAIQQAIDRYRRRREVPIEICVGLSAGDVSWDGDDCFGLPVVEAARLTAAADAGEILAADVVRVLSGTRVDASFSARGLFELKGLAPLPVTEIAWVPLPQRHPVPLPSALSVNGSTFVGRSAERALLDRTWKRSVAGDHTVAVLVGEPGIGKTRLAASFAAARHEDGVLVLFGRCDEGLAVPYQPFVEALRHYIQHGRGKLQSFGDHPQELARLVPELRERVGTMPAAGSADDETQQYRLFDAVTSWLRTTARLDGVVLAVDDIQWAARPTLLMLRHILRTPTPGLLVMATIRDEAAAETHQFVSELGRIATLERISLSGLDESDIAELLAATAPIGMDVTRAARDITTVSSGNPFFVTQIVADLEDSSVSVDVLADHVPIRVRDAIGRRLAAISAAARDTLRHAALLGLEFDIPVLEAWDDAPADVLGALEEAAAAALVEEADLGRFRFVHALVATAMADELTATRRARLHGDAAAAIERAFAVRLDEYAADLARHYSIAAAATPALAQPAMQYSIAAAQQARAQYAFEDAISHYENALAFLPDTAPHPERCDILLALGEAQMRAGDRGARETLLAAADLADRAGDTERLTRAALENNPGYWSQLASVDAERVAVIERALHRCADTDQAARARLLGLLASEGMWGRPNRESRDIVDQALEIARSLGDDATLAQVLLRREMIANSPRDFDDRRALAVELDQLAERLDDPTLRLRASALACTIAMISGDAAETDRRIRDIQRSIEALGRPPYWRWGFLIAHGQSDALRRGQFDEAERLADEGLQIGNVVRNPMEALGYWGLTIASIRFEQGRLAELVNVLEAAVNMHTSPAQVRQTLALAELENNDPTHAQQTLDDMPPEELASTMDSGISNLIMGARLAEIASRLDDQGWAEFALDLLGPYAGRIATETLQYWGAVDRYLGLARTTLGDEDAAVGHLENAIALNHRAEAPTWEARSRLDLARLLVHRDATRASTLASEALATAGQFGMAAVERDANAFLMSLRSRG
jgi:class 3 adenylate cyclase